MSLAVIAIVLSALVVLVTGYLAVVFTVNPATGMAQVKHLPEYLPQAMANRFIGFFLLALAGTVYGDFAVLAVLFAVFALMGVADGAMYQRAGKPSALHFAAGLAAAVAALVAFATYTKGAAG